VTFLQELRHELEEAIQLSDQIAASLVVHGVQADSEDAPDSDEESAAAAAAPLKGPQVMRYYWGQHQRFFMSLCAAMKVPAVVMAVKKARDAGNCAVIGIQSTGEASTKQALADAGGEDLEDFISAPSVVLERLIEKTYQVTVVCSMRFPCEHRSRGVVRMLPPSCRRSLRRINYARRRSGCW